MSFIQQAVRAVFITAFACSVLAREAASQPVRVVLPFGPGSGTDTIARPLFEAISRELNQTFVIDNRPGASGALAAEIVARAAPDGKTLLMTASTTHSINPSLFKKLSYDPVKDFKPISSVTTAYYVLAVGNQLPVNSVAELIAWVKANPTTASYGWGAAVAQMAGADFVKRIGVPVVGVPYKSSPPAMTDLVGGQLSFMFVDLVAGAPLIQTGRLKLLAVTSPKRVALYPAVPTMAESGIADLDVFAWTGLFAPAGTPDDVVKRLADAVKHAVATPEIQKRLEQCCTPMPIVTGAEFRDYLANDRAVWARRASIAGIVPE